MTGEYFATPLRELTAPWWKMLAARLFGRRIVSVDWPTGATMTAYRWRGKLYVAKLKS